MSETTSPDLMDYAGLTQAALRGVIRQAIQRAASPKGLPGEHHFYITFLTQAPGVSIPPELLARYPHDITIVLQHDYRELRVTDELFKVTLTFARVPKVLTVPWGAITRFHDPHAQFMLEFEADEDALVQDLDGEGASEITILPAPEARPVVESSDVAAASDDKPKIVSLDQFRKK